MAEQMEREAGTAPERPRDTAEYIAELTHELAKLARAERLDILAYLLDMAKLEARAAGANGRRRTGRTA